MCQLVKPFETSSRVVPGRPGDQQKWLVGERFFCDVFVLMFFCFNVFLVMILTYIYIMIIMLGRMMFNLISSLFNQTWDIWDDDSKGIF